jgi:hypothetical protein
MLNKSRLWRKRQCKAKLFYTLHTAKPMTKKNTIDKTSKLQNKHRRLNHIYKIIDKKGYEVIFRFNSSQQLLWDKIEEMKEK